jgi:hypothetical protein
MAKTERSAAERAAVLESFPDLQAAPASLVFRLVQLLGDSGEFDRAEGLLANYFFAREEGAVNIRQVYVDLRLKRANSLARGGQCDEALRVVEHLGDHNARLPFTAIGMRPFVTAEATKESVDRIKAACCPPSSR